ncbi:MAG: hypothetical protein LBS24_04955, partial [Clostridiales Family XIII bacterium]|nr:hypothetical protein [Clostridiales Family XIII bacterium]
MSKGSSVEIQKKSEEVPLLQEQADPMQDFAFAELSETVQAAPVQTHARDESFVFVDLFEVFPAQSAARIEEELKTGPPKEVSKRQRKQWTLDKEEALRRAKVHEAALAKRRQEHLRRQAELREQRRLRDEAFYAPARAMTASVEEGIRDWRKTHPEESEGGFSTEYADELSRRLKAEDRTDFSALNVDEVPVLRELTDMLRTLLSTSPSAFSSEAAKAMNARYNALPLPAAAVNAQLDNAGAAQPQANHIFLLHAVALTLYGQTEGQTANPDLRASLYAIAAASGLAAGTVMADPAYRRTREEAVAQERSEQGRAEAATATAATIRGEAQRAEWRAYIRSGQATGAAPRTDWPIAAFEREIWAKAEAGDFDDFDTADFVRTMESFNQNLTENTGQCTRLIRARAAAFPMLLDADFAALIQKEMLAGFENDVWDRQLEQKRMEAAFETAKAGEVFVERSAALAARMDRLCPTEDLKILGGRLRTDGELIQKIIALDDAAFDEFAAELTDQMALNVEVMDGIFSETLRSPVARRLARETFMTDYGANVLLRGTVASVSAGASFFAQRLLSVQSPAAAQEE